MRIFATIKIVTIASLLGLYTTAAFADCTRPRPTFSIPEGGTASEKDLAAADSALVEFGGKVRDYLYCLNGDSSQKAHSCGLNTRDQSRMGSAQKPLNVS